MPDVLLFLAVMAAAVSLLAWGWRRANRTITTAYHDAISELVRPPARDMDTVDAELEAHFAKFMDWLKS